MIKKLAVDLTNAETQADSDQVIAYLVGDDDTPIKQINGSIKVSESCGTFKVLAGTIGEAAAQIDAGPLALANRIRIVIQNLSSRDFYLIESGAQTAADGYWIPPKSEREFPFNAAAAIWLIGETANQEYRFLQLAV